MTETILTISSKNYSSWSLRGWLLCRKARLKFVEEVVPADGPSNRAELLLLSPSILVPCLTHRSIRIWETLLIAEYLQRGTAEGRAVAGGSRRPRPLSLDLRGNALGVHETAIGPPDEPQSPSPRLQGLSGAPAGIDRITTRECFAAFHGPYLFGELPMADAMYAPVVTRFLTYDVKLDAADARYGDRITALPDIAWREAAMLEPEELEELDMEF
jgi:glutathione S-transferase